MNTPNTPNDERGKGSSLTEPSKSDLALVRRAAKERWNIPPVVRETLVVELLKIIRDPGAKRRDRNSAMKTLLSMDKLNIDWARFEADTNTEVETTDYAVDLSAETPPEDDQSLEAD